MHALPQPRTRRHARRLAAALALVLAFLASAVTATTIAPASAAATGSISGTITLPAGATSTSLVVWAESAAGTWTFGTVTGRDYRIGTLPAGTYTVSAESDNPDLLRYTSAPITLAEGASLTRDIALRQAVRLTVTAAPPTGYTGSSSVNVLAADAPTFALGSANLAGAGAWRTPITVKGLTPATRYTLVVSDSTGDLPTLYYPGVYDHSKATFLTVGASGTTTSAGTLRYPSYVFVDVPTLSDFGVEIAWLLDEGLTTGYPDGTYRPRIAVNRDAMAVFLYRFAGSPAYSPPRTSPFTDVSTSNRYYKEIAWLAETGVSRGWGDGTFRPLQPVARDAMAVFLFRFSEYVDPGSTSTYPRPRTAPFRDVSLDNAFVREIAWLADSGISRGWSDGTFRPLDSVARDAMAAFVMRFDAALGCASPLTVTANGLAAAAC